MPPSTGYSPLFRETKGIAEGFNCTIADLLYVYVPSGHCNWYVPSLLLFTPQFRKTADTHHIASLIGAKHHIPLGTVLMRIPSAPTNDYTTSLLSRFSRMSACPT